MATAVFAEALRNLQNSKRPTLHTDRWSCLKGCVSAEFVGGASGCAVGVSAFGRMVMQVFRTMGEGKMAATGLRSLCDRQDWENDGMWRYWGSW
jgi:hypothetical protein